MVFEELLEVVDPESIVRPHRSDGFCNVNPAVLPARLIDVFLGSSDKTLNDANVTVSIFVEQLDDKLLEILR